LGAQKIFYFSSSLRAPDKQEKAMQNVLEQAEVLSEMWAEVS
jgi:hypothetical protein